MRLSGIILEVIFCIVALFGLNLSARAEAKFECLSTFNVKNRSVNLDLLPGSVAPRFTTCEKAEAWRTRYYISNEKIIDAAVAGTSAFYVSELEKNLAARQAAIKDLEDKIDNNAKLSSLATITKVIIGEASKTEALLTCTRSLKSPSCALGIIGIISFSWDVVSGDIAKDKFLARLIHEGGGFGVASVA